MPVDVSMRQKALAYTAAIAEPRIVEIELQ
jgi:hypothetical protein